MRVDVQEFLQLGWMNSCAVGVEVFCKRVGQECERNDFVSPACECMWGILIFGVFKLTNKQLVEAATDTISSRKRDTE